VTTDATTQAKYEALRRSGHLAAAELLEVLRCDSFGHTYALDWMTAYKDPAHAERVKARLLTLVGTVCLECIRWRAKRAESAAWIEAASVRAEIFGHLEKQQQADRAVAEQALAAARVAPPPAPSGRGSRLERALAGVTEVGFDHTV
jgi:hypothetical protein